MTSRLISPRIMILVALAALLLAMAWFGTNVAPVAAEHAFPCDPNNLPAGCEPIDGTLDTGAGTVDDDSGVSQGSGASISVDAGVLTGPVDVTIFTHLGPPGPPRTQNIIRGHHSKSKPYPPDLPGTGATITLPLFSPGNPGDPIFLYNFNAGSQSATPLGIAGSVDQGGNSATFSEVRNFSEFIGLPQPSTEFFQFECNDVVDNDGDGLVDGADPDCAGPGGGPPPLQPSPAQRRSPASSP